MRIAVFSDVHGNLTALEAVLKDITTKDVDEVVFAGDLCLIGPRPAACLRMIQESNVTNIYGNTDDWILMRQTPPPHLNALAQWTAAQLSSSEQSWLDDLAFSHRVSPSDQAQDDLLIVHANPLDVNQLIFPSEEQQMALYGRIRQSDEELGALVAVVEAEVLAFGHLHIPGERMWNKLRLVNISSVSMPGDGDARAKYGIFEWRNGAWLFERQYVSYDMALEVEAYRQAQLPGWETVVESMLTKGFYAQKV